MARPRRYPPLDVFLNGRRLGELTKGSSGAISFRYVPSWLEWEHAIPASLSLPLREQAYTGDAVTAVFDNLLPDSLEIRRTIAARAGAAGTDAHSLLAALGHDCVGALQFLRQDAPPPANVGRIEGVPLSRRDVAHMIERLAVAPLGMSEDESFRISIAGAQEKTALLLQGGKWHRPLGTTPTTHILKPAIGVLENGLDLTLSAENEHLCLEMLRAFEVEVPDTSIEQFGGRTVLVVERFDRLRTKDERLLRLPQEDCCQALSVLPIHKYERDGGPGIRRILRFLRGGDEPIRDPLAFLRANILFWLLGAPDGHAKNFSVFLFPGGRYRMTPLYDVISVQPNVDAAQLRHNRFRLAMAVGQARHFAMHTITPRHFVQSAVSAGVDPRSVELIFEEVAETAEQRLAKVARKIESAVPERLWDSVKNGFMSRLAVIKKL